MEQFLDWLHEHPGQALIALVFAVALLFKACSGEPACYYHTDADEQCEHVGS